MLLQRSHDFAIVLRPLFALRRNYQRSKLKPTSGLNPLGIRPVGDDDSDAGVGNSSSSDMFGDGFEIRTASGEKNADVLHGSFGWSSFQLGVDHNSTGKNVRGFAPP